MSGGERLRAATAVVALAVVSVGCSDGSEPVLLSPAELGDDFAEEPFDGDAALPCGVELAPEPSSTDGAAAVSQRRQQRIVQLVADYARVEDAADAYESTAAGAACDREENFAPGAGEPSPTAIPGADEAFGVEFTGESSSVAVVVARLDERIVVVVGDLHQGASTIEPLGARTVAAVVVDRAAR